VFYLFASGWVGVIVKVLVCVNVCATFPVQLFPVVLMLEKRAFGAAESVFSLSSLRERGFWLRNLLRATLVLVIVGISVAVPFFEVVVSLVKTKNNTLF
jgi:hypothetical protein